MVKSHFRLKARNKLLRLANPSSFFSLGLSSLFSLMFKMIECLKFDKAQIVKSLKTVEIEMHKVLIVLNGLNVLKILKFPIFVKGFTDSKRVNSV